MVSRRPERVSSGSVDDAYASREKRAPERRGQYAKQLAALHDAALTITAELSLDKVLQKIVDVARELVSASYAALGVAGEDGQLVQFVTSGIGPDVVAQIGDRPSGKGVLGVLLRQPAPLRLSDLAAHPESCGFPAHHPPMKSFLGAPLVTRGQIVGSLYLTDKVGASEFSQEDEALIEMLAAQAAVAVENARLFAQSDAALREKVDELQVERRNLKAIIDQLPEGVVIVDRTGREIVQVNRAAATLLGLREADSAHGLAALQPVKADGEPVPLDQAAIIRVVSKGDVVSGEQMVLRRPDGSLFTALANAAPFQDAEGNIVGGIVVFQDITSQKELERLKDELISIISHELRNPLTAIRGRAQLMLRVARRNQGRAEDVVGLEAIDAQVEKLADMVRQLLDVSQMRLGLLELHTQRVDLVGFVRQSVDQFRLTDEVHDIQFQSQVESAIVDADAGRLDQVMFNLLENAAKYSPGGGKITVNISLSSDSADAGRRVVVAVRDEGIGIPEAAHTHLFDRFYRAPNAKGRAETGLGLGLYICHEIINQHGGSLWLESAEGKGSTFYFDLPISS